MKTVLIIGANGFLGSNLVLHLKRRHKVIAAFHRTKISYPGISHAVYMLKDKDYMKRLVTLSQPDVVVYCAGIDDIVECHSNPKPTEAVNSLGPVVISSAADLAPHRFVYLSTAYIYDGVKGNFSESDIVLPPTNYAKQKIAGENYVRSKFLQSTILRLSPVLGIGNYLHPSLIDKIRMRLQLQQEVELINNEQHSFLSMHVFLQVMDWVIGEETKNKTYNLSGLTKMSYYELGIAFAKKFGFDESLILPKKGLFEKEVDFSLNCSEIVKRLQVNPLIIEESLDLLQQELVC